MTAAQKAIPVPDEQNAPYWEGAKEHKLVLQHCAGCGLVSARPRVICPRCHKEEFEWKQVSGKGIIHSYTIVHQTTAAGFRQPGHGAVSGGSAGASVGGSIHRLHGPQRYNHCFFFALHTTASDLLH